MSDERPSLADHRDVETVYQPAEDSQLLAETAVVHVDNGDRVLDAGTGSGFVARKIIDEAGGRVVGSDLNPHACRQASERGVPVVRANLLDAFATMAFDVVVFNPPYLPAGGDRGWNDWMETALSGGETGREVVAPFLHDLRRVLAPDGEAFVLVSSVTGVESVRDIARTNGLTTMEAASESHSFERLVVLHLRPSGDG